MCSYQMNSLDLAHVQTTQTNHLPANQCKLNKTTPTTQLDQLQLQQQQQQQLSDNSTTQNNNQTTNNLTGADADVNANEIGLNADHFHATSLLELDSNSTFVPSEHQTDSSSSSTQRADRLKKSRIVVRKFQKLDHSMLSSTPAPDVKIGQRVAYKEYYGNEFGTIRWIGELRYSFAL